MKDYQLREGITEDERDALGKYSPLLRTLLVARGICTQQEAEVFLSPDWVRDTGDPFDIVDMEKAVERILKAISDGEKVVIYGDYDCDGIPGSVVLHDFFQKIKYPHFSNYIPHRHDEGYGINKDAVTRFADSGVTLMITVDVGIADIDSVGLAQELGIDVIVTDHHEPVEVDGKEKIPPAFAVVNSKRSDCTYHDNMLCGAGVAFKLVQALLTRGKERGMFDWVPVGWEKWLLDMAGLSTIADMVPLVKENRALAHYGLTVMRKSKRLGFLKLLEASGVKQAHIEEGDVGFMIAPRINAASRMDHPLRAFELLSASEEAQAQELAEHLNTINDKRKGHVASMIKEARKRLDARELNDVIVIGHDSWLPGVLGLAANKIVEEYGKPAYVWGFDGEGNIKGSCRSPEGVSVLEIMRGAPDDSLIQFGGHDASGGFSVSSEQIHSLEKVLSESYRALPEKEAPVEYVDAALTMDDVQWRAYNEIAQLAPFGMGNNKPQFIFKGATIDGVREFGKTGGHLGVSFRNSKGGSVDSIGFFMTKESYPEVLLESGESVDLIAVMEKSVFRGRPELRLRIVDILSVGSVK